MVHTFGVKAPLDLVWLNSKQTVIKVCPHVPPNQVRVCFRAQEVIEQWSALDELRVEVAQHEILVSADFSQEADPDSITATFKDDFAFVLGGRLVGKQITALRKWRLNRRTGDESKDQPR